MQESVLRTAHWLQPKCISERAPTAASRHTQHFPFVVLTVVAGVAFLPHGPPLLLLLRGLFFLAPGQRGEISCVEPGIWRGISVCWADSRGAFDLLILLIVPDVRRGRANWEVTHLAVLLFPGDVDHGFLEKSTGVIAQKKAWGKVGRRSLSSAAARKHLMWCVKPLALSDTPN